MAHHVYVYYSVARDARDRAALAVERVVSEMRSVTGIAGRLRRRADDPDLWMEIYENIPDRHVFVAYLQAARGRSGLADCLAPGRTFHTECFVDFDR